MNKSHQRLKEGEQRLRDRLQELEEYNTDHLDDVGVAKITTAIHYTKLALLAFGFSIDE